MDTHTNWTWDVVVVKVEAGCCVDNGLEEIHRELKVFGMSVIGRNSGNGVATDLSRMLGHFDGVSLFAQNSRPCARLPC